MTYNPSKTVYTDTIQTLTDKTNDAMDGIKSDLDTKDTTLTSLSATVTAHLASASAHGATIAANPSAIIVRDAAGRAKVASPVSADDIARKDTVDAVQSALTTHSSSGTAHGSTPAATASAIIQRDSSGRAKVAAPQASDDIARKDTVDAVATSLSTHSADTGAHGASSSATPSVIIRRDSNGRAKVAAPQAPDDIAIKQNVDDVQTALTTHAADASAHNASASITASSLIRRDASGRGKVAAPVASDDIARLDTVQAAQSASAPTGFGLGTVATSATVDWNNYKVTGFYRGQSLLNAPTGVTGLNTWFWVMVIQHDTSWAVQTAYDFNGVGMFTRTFVNAVWGAWKQVARTGDNVGNITMAGRLDINASGTGRITIPVGIDKY